MSNETKTGERNSQALCANIKDLKAKLNSIYDTEYEAAPNVYKFLVKNKVDSNLASEAQDLVTTWLDKLHNRANKAIYREQILVPLAGIEAELESIEQVLIGIRYSIEEDIYE